MEKLNLDKADFYYKGLNEIPISSELSKYSSIHLSADFVALVNEFDLFINDQNSNYDLYDLFVTNNIKRLHSQNEKILFIIMVYVGKSSAIYWDNYLTQWD